MNSLKSQVSSLKSHVRGVVFFSVFIVIISLVFTTPSCKKEEVTPIITTDTLFDNTLAVSDTPKIAFVSIGPNTVREYQDSIQIVVSYEDGGGDLGDSDPAVSNLFMTDSRNGIVYQYRIPQTAPTGSTVSVKGNFTVLIPNTVITDSSSAQNVYYSIYMKDRSNHASNTVQTSVIQIVP
jgi:hypothetical protein